MKCCEAEVNFRKNSLHVMNFGMVLYFKEVLAFTTWKVSCPSGCFMDTNFRVRNGKLSEM